MQRVEVDQDLFERFRMMNASKTTQRMKYNLEYLIVQMKATSWKEIQIVDFKILTPRVYQRFLRKRSEFRALL